jgi:hypothetical protein
MRYNETCMHVGLLSEFLGKMIQWGLLCGINTAKVRMEINCIRRLHASCGKWGFLVNHHTLLRILPLALFLLIFPISVLFWVFFVNALRQCFHSACTHIQKTIVTIMGRMTYPWAIVRWLAFEIHKWDAFHLKSINVKLKSLFCGRSTSFQ